jgi:arylsulfatase
VHEVDTYTTFAKLAGASVPQDRAIDGVDQTDFLLGTSDTSNRQSLKKYPPIAPGIPDPYTAPQ